MKKNMRDVISAAICVLFIATAFSGAVGEMEDVNKNRDWSHIVENKESPDKCAFSDKGDNLDNLAITPAFNLSGITGVKLKFLTQYEIASNSTDFGYVKISSDGGATWSTLAALEGSQPDWIEMEIYMEIDLGPCAGEIILIAFEYSTGQDSISEGWYVDSITVERDGVVLYSEDFEEEYEVGDHWGDWIIVEKAFPVEEITIGTGNPCFSFAIIADPQYDSNNPSSINNLVDAVTEIINRNSEDFVIVLGDLIQGEGTPSAWKGETKYTNEFNRVKTELDRLETAGIHYIPMLGNHDVWFKYPDSLTGGYIPVGGYPDYPEELFADTFGAQYQDLSQDLCGWTKQEDMPSPNPYNPSFPDPLFQNFAFDFGPYHFICLDFNSRKDFDPIVIEGFSPKLRNVWGYADIHGFTYGTLDWLDKHLDECYKRGIKAMASLWGWKS